MIGINFIKELKTEVYEHKVTYLIAVFSSVIFYLYFPSAKLILNLGFPVKQITFFFPVQSIAGIFLHVYPIHLIGNMLAFILFGRFLEKVMGSQKYIVFFFANCLLYNTVLFLIFNSIGVGMSGVICLLIAYSVVVHHDKIILNGKKITKKIGWIVSVPAWSVLFSISPLFFVPIASIYSHVIGFFIGFAFAMLHITKTKIIRGF